jgi:hypothetical protein
LTYPSARPGDRGGRKLANRIDETLGSLGDTVKSYAGIETGNESTRLAEDAFHRRVGYLVYRYGGRPIGRGTW